MHVVKRKILHTYLFISVQEHVWGVKTALKVGMENIFHQISRK